MCGRKFANEELGWQEYKEMLEILGPVPKNAIQANVNICPTQMVPVAFEQDGIRKLEMMRWQLVPHWVKELPDKRIIFNHNAKSETLEEKPTWRPLVNQHRCAVMVSGFYEWTGPKGKRQCHRISNSDGSPMIMAGLWTENKTLDIKSYTIITAPAHHSFEHIHHRMPICLTDGSVDAWLKWPWALDPEPSPGLRASDGFLPEEAKVLIAQTLANGGSGESYSAHWNIEKCDSPTEMAKRKLNQSQLEI